MNLLENLPTEPLDAEQEAALAVRIQAKPGDEDTVNELVLHTMADGFRYMKKCCRAKIPDDELFSLCYRILRMNALRFRPGRVRFIAFSKHGLRGAIARYWNNLDLVKHSSQHEDGEPRDLIYAPEQSMEPGDGDQWLEYLMKGRIQPNNDSAEPSEDPDFSSIDRNEKMAIITEIIDNKLTEQEAMILNLVYTSGFNFPEIGRLLGVTRSAVQLAHAKSIKKIRAELGRQKKLAL